jgi:hypothetical protein
VKITLDFAANTFEVLLDQTFMRAMRDVGKSHRQIKATLQGNLTVKSGSGSDAVALINCKVEKRIFEGSLTEQTETASEWIAECIRRKKLYFDFTKDEFTFEVCGAEFNEVKYNSHDDGSTILCLNKTLK